MGSAIKGKAACNNCCCIVEVVSHRHGADRTTNLWAPHRLTLPVRFWLVAALHVPSGPVESSRHAVQTLQYIVKKIRNRLGARGSDAPVTVPCFTRLYYKHCMPCGATGNICDLNSDI